MAEEASGQEKTEDPTPRRIEEARRKGDIAKSIELPSAAVLLASLLTLYGMSGFVMERMYAVMRHYLGNLHTMQLVPENITAFTLDGTILMTIVVLPVMAVVFVVALVSNWAQFGFLFTTEKLMPQFAKINPVSGFARLFSMQMLINTAKSLAKVGIVSVVAYKEVRNALPGIPQLMDQEPIQILLFTADVCFWILLKAIIAVLVLAIMDYSFQRWEFMRKMRMTKQELKEEAKQTEGDPMVKGRIRSIQMEMSRRRMMAEVPKADVVVTNPTHLAVALHYEASQMAAPVVLAKGAGVIASRIREVAGEHGIPIVEDKPLAQALYKAVDIGEAIPENLFQAVAEVLAYVYNLRRRAA